MAYIGAGITRFNTADGLTVKGTAEFTDTVVLGDSDELRFGAGEDLKIYHDASNSYIEDAGTGALIIRSNSFQAKSADNTTTMFTGAESGAVELYHNNVKRIETTSSGATITGDLTLTQHLEMGDNDEIRLGDSDDLKIYHNGTNSIVQDAGAGILVLAGDGAVQLTKSNLSENMLRALADGAVELYYDNVKKFETTSDGVTISSTENNGPVIKLVSDDPLDAADYTAEGRIQFFAENDASESIQFAEIKMITADITDGTEDGRISFQVSDNGSVVTSTQIGASYLFFNHDQHRIQWQNTRGTSFNIDLQTATPTASRTITLPDATGTVVVQDSSGHINLGDNEEIKLGASGDLRILHDGGNSYIIDDGDGDLFLKASNNHYMQFSNGEYALLTTENGGVELRHNNQTTLATTSSGIDVTGLMNIDGSGSGNGQVRAALSTGGLGLRASSGANNSTVIDFDAPDVSASGGAVTYRFGRGTTEGSSDVSKLQFFNHDGTSGVAAEINSLGQITANNRLALGVNAFIQFEGATSNSNETTLTVTDPTADRTITLPDATGEVVLKDSNGNLLVGTTNTNPAENNVAGIGALANNTLSITRDGNAAIQLNRKTSDGSIAIFRKDGATVGSIKAGGGNLSINSASNYGLLQNADVTQYVWSNGSGVAAFYPESDNARDLGTSSKRFQDLYLSGGLYVGGTGSANRFDDYEEGTWTPTITRHSSNPSLTVSYNHGTYRKVGEIVYYHFLIIVTAVSSNGSGNCRVSGLPFTSSTGTSIYAQIGQIGYNDVWTSDVGSVYATGTNLQIIPAGVTQGNFAGNPTSGYFAGAGWYTT